jgi:Holliday junction DNA helicase RuvB
MRAIIDHGGGPVGIKTIAVTVSEEEETVEEVYEPYLIQQGFVSKTSRGRVVTAKAYVHLELDPPPDGQMALF